MNWVRMYNCHMPQSGATHCPMTSDLRCERSRSLVRVEMPPYRNGDGGARHVISITPLSRSMMVHVSSEREMHMMRFRIYSGQLYTSVLMHSCRSSLISNPLRSSVKEAISVLWATEEDKQGVRRGRLVLTGTPVSLTWSSIRCSPLK